MDIDERQARTEQRILEMMQAGMTREEAEFAVAIEQGEIPGDVIEVDDDASTDADDQ
ncbi:MAG: hypothetical protein ABR578_10065 [Chromatocurvus sp.]